jgi:poly(hydroxyalkanoate) depolymerase family esterase
MYDGLSKGLLRLSRRIAGPRALRRAMRQASELVNAQLGHLHPAPVPTPPRAASPGPSAKPSRPPAIAEIASFGANPGALRMLMYVPDSMAETGAPLVVVLHGCGQHAAQFATETGWIALADRLGLAVVMPEQVSANNAGRCFNWFRADDIARGDGEALSIKQMVDCAVARARLDTRRIYVVGLSAGGAMAAAMLATYPDIFAAGASVAGLPVGCAHDVSTALARMSRAGGETQEELARRARAVGPATPPKLWPRISIWQGDADQTVVPANADQIAAQFAALHGHRDAGADIPQPAGQRARQWRDGGGITVEWHMIAGMSHGYPIASGSPVDRFVLPVGIDATEAIARFWGLLPPD